MRKFTRIHTVLLTLVLIMGMGVNVLAANPALIDPKQKGAITVHKFDNTGTAAAVGAGGGGAEISNTAGFGNPLPGIEFKLTYLKEAAATMTVAAAETRVNAMSAAELAANQKIGRTNKSGVYKFSNLELGVYLVQELASSAVTGTIEPFLVSVPTTNPANAAGWLYDIHVYPKNTEAMAGITKAIRKDGRDVTEMKADVGDKITWVIKPTIPAAVNAIDLAGKKGYYFITDTLDDRLKLDGIAVQLVDPAGAVKETLTANTHFSLTEPAAGTADQTVKIDFNQQAGLDKLLEGKGNGYSLEIVITTTITKTAFNNMAEAVTNSAKLYFDTAADPGKPKDPITTAAAPAVKLTGLVLYKYWLNGTTKSFLNNAVFTIYKSTDAVNSNTPLELVKNTPWRKTTGVTAIAAGQAAADGYIYFSQKDLMTALGYNPDKAADITEFETAYTTFYLVETTAPTGYTLRNEIIPVKLGATAEVENVKRFILPITGGAGTRAFTITGLVLIGGAVVLLLVFRKRKQQS